MKITSATAAKITNLRKQGFSIPEISRGCGVSKSTALRYAHKVKILPRYYSRWLERRNASKIISERNWEIAFDKARKLISPLSEKHLAILAASLYWAEGAKKDFSFLNSDAEMIKIFISILRRVFQVKNADLKISIRIYEDLDRKKCLNYWSKITGIKLGGQTSIEVLRGSRGGKLKYGMCRIRVKKGGLLLKQFSAIIREVSKFLSPRSSTDRIRDS